MLNKRKKGEKPLEIKNDLIMWNINGPKTKPILNEQTEGCDQARLKMGEEKVNLCPKNTSCLKTNRFLSKKKLDL